VTVMLGDEVAGLGEGVLLPEALTVPSPLQLSVKVTVSYLL